jgi:hypothetical protein
MENPELQPEPRPETTNQAAGLRFETTPFQPDGGWTPGGASRVFIAALVAGLGLGWLASLIGQWFYLIVIFPALLGGGVGLAGRWANQRAKVRNPPVAGVVGLVAGCTAMLFVHFFDYHRFLRHLDEVQPGMRAQWEDAGLNFFTFMDAQAQQGVQIGRAGHGDKGMNLGYIGSWIYWGVEMLIVAGAACGILVASAREPFCTQCASWKKTRQLGRLRIPSDRAVQILTSGEIVQLAEHSFGHAAGPLVIRVAECPNCGTEAPVEVLVSEVTKNAKGQEKVKELARVTYPGEAVPVLDALAKPSPPVPPPTPPEATA